MSDIAIVGYAYRAPGVSADETLFDYLAKAKSAWGNIPNDRFDQDAYYGSNKEKAGTFAVQGAHFLKDDVFRFDAPFFNLRAEEARAIDPQHRMLLECAFEAVDHAGIRLHDLAGSETGVFSAVASGDYGQQMADDPLSASNWTATGTAPTMFANRLSYFFDLIGPSVSLDTACASSGYAVHLACQSLRVGECKTALVGGASLLLGPYQFTILDTMGALSPEGRCYSYDHKAAGFGRGEGAACMMLKPLAQALADGDPVQAVIRNTASNHSGRSDGITMPSRTAQVRLLRKVHDQIGLNPRDTPVIEGHGTGTLVGDRIELGAFAEVMAAERDPSDPLYVGSLKSNFGHLEGASGILALTKAVLMVQHGVVLPNADFEKLGPLVEGIERLRVLSSPAPWPPGAPQRVCMTNFGFGGSNAAVLVENISPIRKSLSNGQPNGDANGHTNGEANGHLHGETNGALANGHELSNERLFILSAHSQSSLASYTKFMASYLKSMAMPSVDFLKDLSFTLAQRRTQHAWRVAVTASSPDQLTETFSNAANGVTKARHPLLAWAFTGQGVQYAQMALELWHNPVFATTIDEADAHITAFGATWSLKEEIEKPETDSRINTAELSQPACTAVQLGLIAVLRSWGLGSCAVTGHSSGEIAAAYAAGFLTLEAAMAIAYFRGQAAASLEAMRSSKPKGGMLALGISAEDATVLLQQNKDGYVTIAAINSPRAVTLSGDEEAIENLHRLAETQGIFARRLKVGLAYHSAHMEAVAESYQAAIEPYCNKVALSKMHGDKGNVGAVFVSSLLGNAVDSQQVTASYWVQNLLQPVRFLDAIEGVLDVLEATERTARRKGAQIILEVGPHSGLKTPIQQTISDRHEQQKQNEATTSSASYMSTLARGTPSDHSLLELAGKLFCQGFNLDFSNINQTTQANAKVLTDLPRYAWDRSARYVHQSRIAKAKLHPGVPYDPLIGSKIPSSDGQDHIFRQVFSLDEMPWIREHKVNGINIFPMTGYMAMAIAAARSVSAKTPVSLTLKDVHTKRSLEIAEDERLEMTTKLTPLETGTEMSSSTAWSFKISSWTEKRGWVTHCYGQIEPETREIGTDTPTFQAAIKSRQSEQREELDPQIEYGGSSGVGTLYGDAYRVMQKFWNGDNWTEMESRLRNVEWSLQSQRFGSPVTVDPPSLDAHLQGMAPFLSANIEERPAVVPTYVSRLRVGNDIPSNINDQRFTIVTQCLSRDSKASTTKVGVAVFARTQEDSRDEPSLVPVAEWESVTFRSLSSSKDDLIAQNKADGLPNSFYWDVIPSLDFIDSASLAKFQGSDIYEEREVEERRQLNSASLHYMQLAIDAFPPPGDHAALSVHSAGFLGWASGAVKHYASANTAMKQEELETVSRTSARGELICNIGEQLIPILRGEKQPLEIMLHDNLLWRQYDEDTPSRRLGRVIGRYARSLLDIRGSLRVLEIGAGTGSATLPLLEAFMEPDDGDEAAAAERKSLLSYTYTDISSGFFDTAREKMQPYASGITYKKLDVGQDPLEQGFEAGEYDLVVAANVLHATANMSVTMDHVRTLLKGNGKLVLLEALAHAPLTLPFALLPGWWLAEDDYRDKNVGPLMNPDAWNRLLLDSGFSGVEGTVPDFPDHADQLLGLMCSSRVGQNSETSDTSITICGAIRDDEEEQFASLVAEQVTDRLNCQVSVKPLSEVDTDDDDAVCILLDSPVRSILQQDEMTEEAYETLRRTLLTTKALLWVIPEDHTPEHEVIRGILRSLRLEDVSGRILLLENVPSTEEGAAVIARLAQRLQDPEVSKDLDQDFVFRDGKLHVARLRPLATADEAFAAADGKSIRRVQPIWREDTAMELTVDAAGSPDFIYFRNKPEILEIEMSDNEILIRNEAVGMNFRDLLVILGSIPWTPPGYEGVGTVLRKGSDVSDLQVGDRVCYGSLTGGSYSTMLRIPAWHAFKIPDHLSTEEAAGISTPYSTAVMALVQIGRLRKGETVLIHAASGGVGQACIVLAQHIGARVFVTAGSDAKRTFLREIFNIPESQIFSSRTSDFRDSILHTTNGEGVDVIVNSLSGRLLHDTWALIAESGRFVEIGKKDILSNSHLAMRHFEKNVTFSGVDLRMLFEKRPEEMKDCLAKVVELLDQGVVKPIKPQTVLPISQLAAGLRKLQSGQNIGKIVITISPGDRVLAEIPPAAQPEGSLLRSDATYLITGGTGGIGRSLAPWMFQNGAGNVVLLGRSGGSNPEVARLLEQYEDDRKVRLLAVACDVSSKEDFAKALEEIKSLPPIRGVVHGALSIHDAFLSNSSYADWQNTTAPKIPAAWNLHELLPNLDFFVSLGSFLGACGNAGQTIYSGTSSFLDAFTAYRNSQGLPSVSIALPIVLGVGYVADRAREEEMTTRVGMTLTEGQVHTLIRGAIIGPPSGLNHNGVTSSFNLPPGVTLTGQWFHPRNLMRQILDAQVDKKLAENGGEDGDAANENGSPLGLLDALIQKVSSMTMIDRKEMEADAPLDTYGLDSLVSVELRNWIRRETGVELSLAEIGTGESLAALAATISSMKKK